MTPHRLPGGHEDLVERIARDIQSGALAAGAWLKQIDLETRYGATRPAVRRALDQLAEKRLVRHVANRGYSVSAPDDAKTREILGIRVILETGVAGDIVAGADAAEIGSLRRLAERFETLIAVGTLLELYAVNLEFHRALLRLSGNSELVDLVDALRSRTSSAPATQWQTRRLLDASAAEHHAMVDAVERRDVAALKGVIARHIIKP